ncbi:MAG: hypothetical protein ABFD69_13260 [Candidatus Sumerlaeia bacterium]
MLYRNGLKILLMATMALIPPAVAGCNKIEMQRFRAGRQESPREAAGSTLRMGSHDVTVLPGSELTGHSEMIRKDGPRMVESFEFNVGQIQVLIEDENLYVNRKFYGRLATGDVVLVEHDRVRVNGRAVEVQERSAPPPAGRPGRPVKLPMVA